ncbi:hypothetical protein ACLOJK_028289 [Asimina triloba]
MEKGLKEFLVVAYFVKGSEVEPGPPSLPQRIAKGVQKFHDLGFKVGSNPRSPEIATKAEKLASEGSTQNPLPLSEATLGRSRIAFGGRRQISFARACI